MGSSLNLDDDGQVTITIQVSETKYKTIKFNLSDVSHVSNVQPGVLRAGRIEFHFKSGKPSQVAQIPSGQKRLFRQLIHEANNFITINSDAVHTSKPNSMPKSKTQKPKDPRPVASKVKTKSAVETFASVDVEWTDSSDRTSLCEIGVAIYSNGQLKDTFRAYLRPLQDFQLGGRELSTHGIHEHLILSADTLADHWQTLRTLLGDYPWVLHNATNDINKILTTLIESGMSELPSFNYFDTMLMSRKIPWIESRSGLDDLADFFTLERSFAYYDDRDKYASQPHGALEDAILTGEILVEMLRSCGYKSLAALTAAIKASPGKVRQGVVENGFSAPGKLPFSRPEELPDEEEVVRKLIRDTNQSEKAEEKRRIGDSAKRDFLENPNWSTEKVSSGQKVCFTQLANWDENGVDHKALVEKIAIQKGLQLLSGIRSDLDLLVVNDPWVMDSAKLRDALGRKNPIPVTLYSIFQKYNPEFPVWNYRNAPEYREMKASGIWPEEIG